MDKEKDIEKRSLEDLEKIIRECKKEGAKAVVIGGYAVRAYTSTRLRYTRDIDLVIASEEDLQKLRFVLAKEGYIFKKRPHGLSGFKRCAGIPIVLNVSVGEMESEKKTIKSFYGSETISVDVASIEELLAMKIGAGRERDIIDVCILILESYELINLEKLKKLLSGRGIRKEFLKSLKHLLDLIGTKSLRVVWHEFIGRKITKKEEEELWKRLSYLTKNL